MYYFLKILEKGEDLPSTTYMMLKNHMSFSNKTQDHLYYF